MMLFEYFLSDGYRSCFWLWQTSVWFRTVHYFCFIFLPYIAVKCSCVCFQHTQSSELSSMLTDIVKPEQLPVYTPCVEAWGVRDDDGDEFLPDRHQLHWVVADSYWQSDDTRPYDVQGFARLAHSLLAVLHVYRFHLVNITDAGLMPGLTDYCIVLVF